MRRKAYLVLSDGTIIISQCDTTGGATGEQVLYWFNDKSHGGRVQGEHKFWDEAIEEINEIYGGIPNLFKRNCKKAGIPIK